MAVNPSGKVLATGSPDKVCIALGDGIRDKVYLRSQLIGGTIMGSSIGSTNWKTYRPYGQYSYIADK